MSDDETITTHSTHIYKRKPKSTASILPDLEKYTGIPPVVVQKANEIYASSSMKDTIYRMKKRRMMLYYCVYCACKELGNPSKAWELAKIFDLTSTDVTKCLNLFSPLITGYQPPEFKVTATHYVADFAQQLNLDPTLGQSLKLLADNLLQKHPNLSEEKPLSVAAGIVAYYLKTYGLTEQSHNLAILTNKSVNTLDLMSNRIAEYDNS